MTKLFAGATILTLLLQIPLWAQYQGGDFVTSNEEDLKTRYNVESEEELVQDLQSVLNLAIVGIFPRRKTQCLKYKETRTSAKKALEIIRKVVPVLPKSYRIVVIGNADKRGRETSMRGKRGNDYWSAMRAKSVSDYIVSQYPEAKNFMLMGGQGSKLNKRAVTFKILPKAQAEKLHSKLIRKFKWE